MKGRFSVRTRRYLTYLILACCSASVLAYAGFVHRPVLRIEGERPVPIREFGNGTTVTHAFLMDDDRLHAVSVRVLADEAASVRVAYRLLGLYERIPGSENDPNLYSQVYRWTDAFDVPAGDHWQRIAFPPIGESHNRWYVFEIRLLDAMPKRAHTPRPDPFVSLMASEDNPFRGGKLWIAGERQKGSLFLRADGQTPYERFRLGVEPRLPSVLRNRAVQVLIVLVSQWAFVALAYAMLFRDVDDSENKHQPPSEQRSSGGPRTWSFTVAVCQIIVLSGTLALFFLVPESPAASLPLFPELTFLGTLCLLAALGLRSSSQSPGGRWRLRRDETLWLACLAVCFAYTALRAIQTGLGFHLGFDPCGYVSPSAIVRLECRLQASYSQNYAWRSITQLTLILCIGLVTAFMARTISGFWRNGLIAIVLVALLHASVGFIALWAHTAQVVPKWIMVNSMNFDRFTFLFPYPAWAWLQMAPALAISVWQANYGLKTRNRIMGAAAALILACAIAATKQRGGLLLVGSLALLSLGATILKGTFKTHKFGYGIVPLALSAVICFAILYSLLTVQSHTGGLFVNYRTRLIIWNVAITSVVKQHAWFGFGYARWNEFGSVAIGTPAQAVLDSAHSLWVQLLFELGLTGILLVAMSLFATLFITFRNSTLLQGGPFLVLSALTAFAISATFEEVDYIRPVFVTHAFMAGICCELPFARSRAPLDDLSQSYSTIRLRQLFAGLAVLSLVAALATRVYFTWGAFEFEASTSSAEPRGRLLAQRSTIPVYGPPRLWVFKAEVFTKTGTMRLTPPAGESLVLDVTKDDNVYLPMYAGRALWPRRHRIEFDQAYDAWWRQVAGRLVYPPILTAIPLVMTRGATEPEQSSRGLSFVCVQQCVLAFLHDTRERGHLTMEVETPAAVASNGRALEVSALASYFGEPKVSLDARSERIPLGKAVLTRATPRQRMTMVIPARVGWYSIRFVPNSVLDSMDAAVNELSDVEPLSMRVLILERPDGD